MRGVRGSGGVRILRGTVASTVTGAAPSKVIVGLAQSRGRCRPFPEHPRSAARGTIFLHAGQTHVDGLRSVSDFHDGAFPEQLSVPFDVEDDVVILLGAAVVDADDRREALGRAVAVDDQLYLVRAPMPLA